MKITTFSKNLAISLLFISISASTASAQSVGELSFGSQGDDVYSLQVFLIQEGFFTVEPTGNFYSYTLAALKNFQKAYNVPVTGVYDAKTQSVVSKISTTNTFNEALFESVFQNNVSDSVDSFDEIPAFDQNLENKS